MQKIVQRKLRELAAKHNISEKEITKIYESQFELIKQTAESADRQDPSSFKSIRLIKLGLFYVKESVKKAYIEEKIKENKNG